MGDRLPPGQVLTTKWPVLHYGLVPSVDTKTWTFTARLRNLSKQS